MPNQSIPNHPLIDTTVTYGPTREPFTGKITKDLVAANGMRAIVRAVFHNWNDVSGLTMFYCYVPETGYTTHFSPTECGYVYG